MGEEGGGRGRVERGACSGDVFRGRVQGACSGGVFRGRVRGRVKVAGKGGVVNKVGEFGG